ncbi:hypothetical protein EVAR_32831_1 [Eumeta japonica]|uniref:Uncharacterized protein n=1 Tax=Eumeta variegata TaxID=151549 RepID=A0A4C1WC07_EUMVA|nr:hypothetical protein EVAR_32831_1 [Eumeta japonica]
MTLQREREQNRVYSYIVIECAIGCIIKTVTGNRMRNSTAIWSESKIAQYNGRRNPFASTRGRGERGARSTKEANVVWNLRNDVLKRKVR